jgi:hypothetical protein
VQFQVPQFIEVEDKVFGPFTFRQFLYMAGGVGLSFIFYVYLPIYIAIFPIAACLSFAAALTFYKHNGRDFIYLAESVFKYFVAKKLYLWKKADRPVVNQTVIPRTAGAKLELPRLSASRLKELSWSLDVKDNAPKQEEENGP